MTAAHLAAVVADHGSLATSLPFLAPVALLLAALGALTLRDRRRAGRRARSGRT